METLKTQRISTPILGNSGTHDIPAVLLIFG
jgi:hypothetical protein